MTDLLQVRQYWQEHPLHSFELGELGTPLFFENLDRIKKGDIEKYAIRFFDFNNFAGKKVLDVGCGPGWFTVQYALGGAQVTSIDLTPCAVELTQKHLAYKNLTAQVQEANAETLPFEDEKFDLVISLGVLHHTPKTLQALGECFRVLKPGGNAKIALYQKGILLHPQVFRFVRKIMQILGVKHPGADLSKTANNIDEFIRQYDGVGNPPGIAKTVKEWKQEMRQVGFDVKGHELHYFPKRFIPLRRWIPDFVHEKLDRYFGTLVYFKLEKGLKPKE